MALFAHEYLADRVLCKAATKEAAMCELYGKSSTDACHHALW